MSKKNTAVDDDWNRFPDVKFRMREDGLQTILDGLSEEGFCSASAPRIELLDDGVYIEIMLNVGKHGSVMALPLDVFLPAKIPVIKKKKNRSTEIDVSDAPTAVNVAKTEDLADAVITAESSNFDHNEE